MRRTPEKHEFSEQGHFQHALGGHVCIFIFHWTGQLTAIQMFYHFMAYRNIILFNFYKDHRNKAIELGTRFASDA